MKIKNSSRITALILTLVMILPLISLPTFAEEVKTPVGEVLYSNDFEQYTAGQAPTAGDFTQLPSSTKAEKMDGDIALKLDWTGAKNEGNINANLILKTPAISHEDHSVITVEADYWFSTDATGKITVQFRKFVSTQKTSETWWLNLCDIAADGTLAPSAGISKVAKITKGAWNNVKLVINLKTGSVNFFVNDEYVTYGFATNGATPQTNIKLTAAELIIAKPATTAEGSFAVDNVKITSGTTGLTTNVFRDDFERLTVGKTVASGDMGNSSAGASIPTTVTVAKYESNVLKYNTSIQGKTDKYFVGTATSSGGGTKKTVTSVVLGEDNKPTKVTVDSVEYTVTELDTASKNGDGRKTGVVIPVTTTNGTTTTTTTNTNFYLYNAYEWEYFFGGDVVDKMILAKNPALSYENYDSLVFELKYYISADFKADMELQFFRTNNGGYQAFYSLYGYNNLVYLSVDKDQSTPLYRGTWNIISMVLNLDTGKYDVYVNGEKASDSTGDLPAKKTNWSINADCWSLAKVSKKKCTANSGYIMIDDVCIYEGTEPRKQTMDLYRNDFEHYALGNAVADAYIKDPLKAAAADATHKVKTEPSTIVNSNGGKALQIYYKGTNNVTVEGVNMDKNVYLQTPELSYKYLDSVVFDFDVLIPANSTGQIHIRYGSAKVSGSGSYPDGKTAADSDGVAVTDKGVSWTPDLFGLTYTSGTSAATITSSRNGNSATGLVPVGKWVTLSAVINLDSATVTVFVNGKEITTSTLKFQYSNNGWKLIADPKNVTLNAGSLAITGDSTARKTQIEGNILFDNVTIYEGTAPKMKASDYFRYDFEDDSSVSHIGYIGSALSRTALFASIPGSLQFKTFDKNTVLSLTMGADPSYSTAAGSAGYEFVIYGARVMDITNAYTADGVTYYAKGNSNDRAIKFTKNNDGTIQIIGYAASKDANNGELKNLTNTAESVGALKYTTKNEKATIHSSKAMLEVGGVGAKNIDMQVRFNAATFTSGTVVLEAKYYIPTGAKGQSQIQDTTNGWKDVTIVNLTNSTIAGVTVSRDEWHTLTTIVDVAAGKASLYVDGAFAKDNITVGDKGTFNASKWIFAKVMKETTLDAYAGELYIDDVAVEAYEADRVLTVAPEAGKNFNYATFTFNGVTSDKITATGGKYFNAVGSNAAINYTYFDATAFAGIVDTEAEVQVRLAANSGLRFATKINTELLDALKNDENIKSVMFGTLIAPERYLVEGVELTVESLTAADQKLLQVEPTAIDAFYQGYDNDDATTHYVGSIVDILASNIGENFCARGYVKVELLSGEIVYIYSADYATRNVKEAATAIIAEVGAENLDEVYGAYAQILRNYAAGLQADAE